MSAATPPTSVRGSSTSSMTTTTLRRSASASTALTPPSSAPSLASASTFSLRLTAPDPTHDQRSFNNRSEALLAHLSSGQELLNRLSALAQERDINLYLPDDSFAGALQVLDLDLRFGHLPTDAASLNAASLTSLLLQKITLALTYLDKLNSRIKDSHSKVLVTGDVNCGKSTLVNALLRRDVCPVDQQPWTVAFSEIIDAKLNEQQEEAHWVKPGGDGYNRADKETFTRVRLGRMESIVTDERYAGNVVKVYVRHNATPGAAVGAEEGGVVVKSGDSSDLVLIDGPGLNTDTIKTLATFARQEEIDVVVFVVNAENHFTLSGREFLRAAQLDKAHIFIVVNKFDNIRDRERCRRTVLAQLKEVCPSTYQQASDLVHFVSAREVVQSNYKKVPVEFSRMERCLRWFTLEKHVLNKLGPAKRYLAKLTEDVHRLARMNRKLEDDRLQEAEQNLEGILPEWERIKQDQQKTMEAAEQELEICVGDVLAKVRSSLKVELDSLKKCGRDVKWNGPSSLPWYVAGIRKSMISAWNSRVSSCEQWTMDRVRTSITHIYGLSYPNNATQLQHPRLELMFQKRSISADLDSVSINITDLVDVRERMATLGVGSGIGLALAASQLAQPHGQMMLGFGRILLAFRPNRLGGKFLLISLGITVLAGFWWLVGDFSHAVHNRVAKKLKDTATKKELVERETERIRKRAAAALRFAVGELNKMFQQEVNEREQLKQTHEEKKNAALEGRKRYRELSKLARKLREQVDSVPVDDDLANDNNIVV